MYITGQISVPMLTRASPEQDLGYLLLLAILLHGDRLSLNWKLAGEEVLCLPSLRSRHLAALLFTLVLKI